MSANIRAGRSAIVVLVLWMLLALMWKCWASDISKGYTFTPTDRVTATKLNDLVDASTINSSFLTSKPAATPAASDSFLFYSVTGTGYRKCTLSTLLLDNASIITSKSEDTTPVGADYLLTYDVSATSLKKTQLDSLVFTNFALIGARTNWPTPGADTCFVLGYDSGSGGYAKISLSNLVSQQFTFTTFTNLAEDTTPTNTSFLFEFDQNSGQNRKVTLNRILSNAPTTTVITGTDYFFILTNGIYTKLTFNTFSNSLAQGLITSVFPSKYTSTQVSLANWNTASNVLNEAHGLAGKPQVVRSVLVCTAASQGYAIGDEVELAATYSSGSVTIGNAWANSTNVGFSSWETAANTSLPNKTTGATATASPSSWAVKIYAVYFP